MMSMGQKDHREKHVKHMPLIHLSEKRLHLQRPGCWVAGMDLVEGLKNLVSRCAGSHHIWPLRGEDIGVNESRQCVSREN